MVFQKKVFNESCLDPWEGGPAESHREYYVGGGLLRSPPRLNTRVLGNVVVVLPTVLLGCTHRSRLIPMADC